MDNNKLKNFPKVMEKTRERLTKKELEYFYYDVLSKNRISYNDLKSLAKAMLVFNIFNSLFESNTVKNKTFMKEVINFAYDSINTEKDLYENISDEDEKYFYLHGSVIF